MDPKLPEPGIPEHWGWPNFTPAELTCKHTGVLVVVPAFMDRLQGMRLELSFPLPVTSGYRHPTHPAEAKKAQPGSHAFARAVDIAISGERAFELVAAALRFGFTGIGVSQNLNAPLSKRFVHLDDMTAADSYHAPRPFLWSY